MSPSVSCESTSRHVMSVAARAAGMGIAAIPAAVVMRVDVLRRLGEPWHVAYVVMRLLGEGVNGVA